MAAFKPKQGDLPNNNLTTRGKTIQMRQKTNGRAGFHYFFFKLDFITLIFVNNTNPLQGRLAVGYIYVVSDWILGMLGKIFKYTQTE